MATKLVLEINCDNAAFGDSPDSDEFGNEVGRILRHAAQMFEDGYAAVYLNDSNGNRVGFVGLQLAEG
jgi:hypothetical protein